MLVTRLQVPGAAGLGSCEIQPRVQHPGSPARELPALCSCSLCTPIFSCNLQKYKIEGGVILLFRAVPTGAAGAAQSVRQLGSSAVVY